MKRPRASSYMYPVEIDSENTLLISGSTLCMDLVPTEYAARFSSGKDLSFLSGQEQQHLLERGHLTQLTPTQELAEFKKSVNLITRKTTRAEYRQKSANISFILTYGCNLACTYCYQSSLPVATRRNAMTAELVDEFFTECFPQLFPTKPKHCSFTLFGGEPLLPSNREAISRICHHTRKFKNARINVATNATTLPEMIDLIGPDKGQIQSVQVTLDGDQQWHDGTRITASGRPTFASTIRGIRLLIDAGADIGIRVHIHPKRMASTERLVHYLEEEGLLGHPQTYLYFSPINSYTDEQTTPEEIQSFRRVFHYVAERTGRPPSNLIQLKKFLAMQGKTELPNIRYCGLGTGNFYMIDPMRDIYQCYEDTGHSASRIGSFAKGKVKMRQILKSYRKRHLINVPECLRCPIALLCGGGCPVEARQATGSLFKPYCHQNKEFIAQTLKALYLKQIREQAKEQQQDTPSARTSKPARKQKEKQKK